MYVCAHFCCVGLCPVTTGKMNVQRSLLHLDWLALYPSAVLYTIQSSTESCAQYLERQRIPWGGAIGTRYHPGLVGLVSWMMTSSHDSSLPPAAHYLQISNAPPACQLPVTDTQLPPGLDSNNNTAKIVLRRVVLLLYKYIYIYIYIFCRESHL
jgi:hypothetical protein